VRIEYTKQTSESVDIVKSLITETLVIETPDPEPVKPAPLVVNMTVADPFSRGFASGGYIDGTRPKPEPRYGTSNEVHFNATPGERIPCEVFDEHEFQAKARRDRPNRDIPLWAFQRDFIRQEFPGLGPHGAAKLADHFMDQWRRRWFAGRSDG
jgi:hypothetical protein